MNVIHVSHSDLHGGASIAAYRLHQSLIKFGLQSRMLVQKKISDNPEVISPTNYYSKAFSIFCLVYDEFINRLQNSPNMGFHTAWGFSSFTNRKIKSLATEIINLHWTRGIPSISEIGKFNVPVVWTLHDMWAFCGSEHYSPDSDNARWRKIYSKMNRSPTSKGIDVDKLTWSKKRKKWKRNFHIVAPSNWIAECVRSSSLMASWPVTVIPYPIDTKVFSPIDKLQARSILNLPPNEIILLFGAIGGGEDSRKGFDLLLKAINDFNLFDIFERNIRCVVFGQSEPKNPPIINFPVTWFGILNDEWSLSLLYSAADVMIIPSRQDNLPQTGIEAHACGCPVVAFRVGGLPDIVEHLKTGYLAEPLDPKSLAQGIYWVLGDFDRQKTLSHNARAKAAKIWSPNIVAQQYVDVYRQAISEQSPQLKNKF